MGLLGNCSATGANTATGANKRPRIGSGVRQQVLDPARIGQPQGGLPAAAADEPGGSGSDGGAAAAAAVGWVNLGLEEAMYLRQKQLIAVEGQPCAGTGSAADGAPALSGGGGGGGPVELNVQECWALFCEILPAFPWRYAVYAHLRDTVGGVPRSGCLYGADFLLYKAGQPLPRATTKHAHAESCIYVRPVDEGRPIMPSWADIQLASRLGAEVSKAVQIYMVHLDTAAADDDDDDDDGGDDDGAAAGMGASGGVPPGDTRVASSTSLFECAARMKVLAINVRRWTPKADRQKPAATAETAAAAGAAGGTAGGAAGGGGAAAGATPAN
eukprot:SAG22_NODE_202_length_15324_cov_7.802627_5_plen_329_part_00